MYPLARLAMDLGFSVRGCDKAEGENVRRLTRLGIPVEKDEERGVLPLAQAVVYTLAAQAAHPLLKAAERRRIPVLSRTELLGYLSRFFKTCATVAGTHGKSSTVGFCASILEEAGFSPTVLCGAGLSGRDGGYVKGKKDILLVEACEYKRAFLSLRPTHALALGADYEHPDCYRSEEDVRSAFASYLSLPTVKKRVTPVGFYDGSTTFGKGGDLHKREERLENGRASFSLYHGDRPMGRVALSVAGTYQAENALAAAALCHTLGADDASIVKGLSAFRGISGRMELKGYLKGMPIYLDYAHHPVELAAALGCAATLGEKVVCVFEGHTYSRVRAFEKDFSRILAIPHRSAVLPIFPARETDTLGMSGEKMARDAGADYLPDYNSAAKYLSEIEEHNAVFLLVGAGNVGKILSFLSPADGYHPIKASGYPHK